MGFVFVWVRICSNLRKITFMSGFTIGFLFFKIKDKTMMLSSHLQSELLSLVYF